MVGSAIRENVCAARDIVTDIYTCSIFESEEVWNNKRGIGDEVLDFGS